MLKLSALNEESEEESPSEEEVTREALEQIALQQYAKALELQRKGNITDATQLLKDLLETELLDDIKKPAPGEKHTGPLFNLKYLCYKNLGSMLSSSGDVEAGIEAYIAASELDDSDITLWHRLGQLCLHGKRYEMALHAFQKGTERNPKHWPCLDKIVTLLLGLDFKEECISTIYDTLQLDPGYLRGLSYRRHIYTTYPYIKRFMEYLNPIYKWNESDDEQVDEEQAEKLLKEAENIHKTFLEQQRAEKFKCTIPNLTLNKPITQLTWESVGDSLVQMHHFITANYFSHACHIEIVYKKGTQEEPMEISEQVQEIEQGQDKTEENNVDSESNVENEAENGISDISDKEKAGTDTDKVESNIEMVAIEMLENLITTTPLGTTMEKSPEPFVESTDLVVEILSTPVTENPVTVGANPTAPENQSRTSTENPAEPAAENPPETKKKQTVRRRSAISCLQQWEWCTKRRSGRKQAARRKERIDDNIYGTLRSMVPICLHPEVVQKKEEREKVLKKPTIFDEKHRDDKKEIFQYFGTESEQNDVKDFIKKYTEDKRDVIEMLKDFLIILAAKWKIKWPNSLPKIYIDANKCYNSHIDIPACIDENKEQLLHYTMINLLVEELAVNEKLNITTEVNTQYDLSVIETVGMILALKPHIFPSIDILEFTLRHLWVKLHIHVLNKHEEFGLDYLYQLSYEFEAMGEYHSAYSLEVINFTFKPVINEQEICAYIKFLERNKKLSTVMELYKNENYEDVLTIVLDSFEHGKDLAKKQEEMSLDFAVQLSVILDTYWALDKVDECFKWSLVCLHVALKHYFRYTSGSTDYEKWTLTVVKILCCMEHILTTEGLSCLEAVSQKELSQGLDDLIRIIGHQIETNAAEIPFGTVIPWILMHYILQREEDQGRGRYDTDSYRAPCDEIPNPLVVLFIGHEQLGLRGWCCKSDGKLLYFILDTVVPRLRSPSLAKCLDQVCQYMEQCVYCLFGHPSRKNKLKYLMDHNVTPQNLDWKRAQQVYEIFKPPTLPALEGKNTGITADTEQLFHRILEYLPPEQNPQKYVPDIEKYIMGVVNRLPSIPPLLPYKMRDIYFLLGDYYFKKEEGKMAIKYNIYDVIINNNRLESWAEISLAKAMNLERLLNSCKNLNNEREFLNPAKAIIRCFQRTLELDPTHYTICMWIEYGVFVYMVHSFCSRALKTASESLSMENFEFLEKQKEDMLDMTQKCFMAVVDDMNNTQDTDKSNEDTWLNFYMLGKVAEKRNKPPSVYMDYYAQAVKRLQVTNAKYPLKINYNQPSYLSIEVLEIHYRIHASILKYIEQHENKPIPASVGKVFLTSIQVWRNSLFSKKPNKDVPSENETENKVAEPVQAANILKRSISDAGEEESHEAKRLKIESAAAKVRRSASYDTERLGNKDAQPPNADTTTEGHSTLKENIFEEQAQQKVVPNPDAVGENTLEIPKVIEQIEEKIRSNKETKKEKKGETSSSSSSSSSSSDSSSSDSTSDSSSDSSKDSDTVSESKPLTDDEIMQIVSSCLDALEDCASRFPPHYKAIYRLAHYHFYYKKGKDIERCRDLMLSNFTSRSGQKLSGLFNERKPSNFFNNIWKIPLCEVDRAGGFAFHMNRSVLLTMEILKEIDDHKTLLDLSLYLQRIPDPDKTYLRDSDREELAQQAFSLCVQSLKGQLLKFSQQADLKINNVEKQAFKSLMLDIYRAYLRVQKQPNSKQFTNLLVDAYKLVTTGPITESMNLVDLSMRYCQSLIQALRQQAMQANLDKSQNAQKKQTTKVPTETAKVSASTNTPPKTDSKAPTTTATSTASIPGLPKMSLHEMAAAFQSFLPMLPSETRQTAAALSYLNNLSALTGYPPSLQNTLQASLQNTLQNSFQAEFYRQFLGQTLSAYNLPPPPKKKRGPKPGLTRSIPSTASGNTLQIKTSKSFPSTSVSSSKAFASTSISSLVNKTTTTPVITSLQKATSAPLAPSMGTVLPTLPASLTANIVSSLASGVSSHSGMYSTQAHTSNSSHINTSLHSKYSMPHTSSASVYSKSTISQPSNVNSSIYSKPSVGMSQSSNIYSKSSMSQQTSKSSMPQQQLSPGKTLQEKLAEKQKTIPSTSNASRDITSSINKLPSSLTITKTSVPKPPAVQKKPESNSGQKSKPISSDEIIVLDDD